MFELRRNPGYIQSRWATGFAVGKTILLEVVTYPRDLLGSLREPVCLQALGWAGPFCLVLSRTSLTPEQTYELSLLLTLLHG